MKNYIKDYFIRLCFGLLSIGVIFGLGHAFNIPSLKEGDIGRNLWLVPIAIISGWGGWYLYRKLIKTDK
ncbi:hypothetical protein [Mesobacillus foraminis]|uniref:hypothetical protein n=1 Tax=Mesobacillus foraminis TaxID=279826 RepID=UPI000EF4C650|nr:hypothetical protein [Mesobacillus foraminis]